MQPLCPWEPAQYFLFSSNVPSFLYYSHLTAILTAIIFAIILIPRVRESLPVKLFLATIFFFTVWTVIDLPLWALNRPDIDLFLWSLQVLTELFMYVSAFYFAYVFIAQKDLKFLWKIGLVILLIPVIVLLPTSYLFPGVDISSCVISENPLLNFSFTYGIEILLSFLILFVSFLGISTQPRRKKEVILFTTGLIVFLIAFSSGNIVGSLTEDWNSAQAGLFGMPVFIAFLTYTVVKFKTFNVKLIATQALVAGITVLIGARLFYSTTTSGTILSAATLVAFLISGFFLIKSVKGEIEQREHAEKLAKELKIVNEMQADTTSLITHQIRGVFTNTKSGLANIIEGSCGLMSPELMTVMDSMFKSQVEGVKTVETFLQAQKIESGTIQYDKKYFDLKAVVEQISTEEKPRVDSKGLQYEVHIDSGDYMFNGDQVYLTQVIANLIDNAIRYTEKGSITVQLSKKADSVLYSVKDSGIGIPDEDKEKMFTKYGHGKDSRKINADTAGLGLYIVKGIVVGHGGKIWYETEVGKGTTFFVELPVNQLSTGG